MLQLLSSSVSPRVYNLNCPIPWWFGTNTTLPNTPTTLRDMSSRRRPNHNIATGKLNAPLPVMPAKVHGSFALTNPDNSGMAHPPPHRPVLTSFPFSLPAPVTASSRGLCIDEFRSPSSSVQDGSADLDTNSDDMLDVELFGEDPAPFKTKTSPRQATTTQPCAAQTLLNTPDLPVDPEAILQDFYRTRSKKSSYQERIKLCKATGLPSKTIAQWFTNMRHEDPNSTCTPHDKILHTVKVGVRKPRMTLKREQIMVLEGFFKQNAHPDAKERALIAAQLMIPSEAVYNWFRHKRAKDKKLLARSSK